MNRPVILKKTTRSNNRSSVLRGLDSGILVGEAERFPVIVFGELNWLFYSFKCAKSNGNHKEHVHGLAAETGFRNRPSFYAR